MIVNRRHRAPFGPLTSEPPEWHADLARYQRRTEAALAERTTVPPCAAADRLFALMAENGKATPDAQSGAAFSSLWTVPAPTPTEETA
jgi:hypothetical protein